MSTLAEMVEEEAAQAEAEEPDEEEEETEEPEPEPEPEPEEPEAFVAIGEKEIKQAERAILAQKKRLAGILGEAAVAHDCLLCAGLGFVPELPPPGTEFALLPDEEGAPQFVVKPPVERPRVKARDKEQCDWCEGDGFVDSGSNFPPAIRVPCSKCQGNGWFQKTAEGQGPAISPALVEMVTITPSEGALDLPPDQWGRPYGHQHWGVPPASIPG